MSVLFRLNTVCRNRDVSVEEGNSGRTTSMLTQDEGLENAPIVISSPTDSYW
jgi:hypothetical protein